MNNTHYITRFVEKLNRSSTKKNRGLVPKLEEWTWYEFLEQYTAPESSWTWVLEYTCCTRLD
jgi:hypothetical protein